MKITFRKLKNYSLLFCLICTFFTSCQKTLELSATNQLSTSTDLSTKVNASMVSGFVTNENNTPVKDAPVLIGTTTTLTDKYGYFEAKNVQVIQNAAVVIVSKTGYFKGIKTFIATAGKGAFFRIKLIPKISVGTISGTAGGLVTLTGGLKISFPANAIMNAATNIAYTGALTVNAKWLNPFATDLNSIMPGDLRGTDATGALKLLTTYGMAAVELTGASGELLQIATGKKATITMPIPTTMLGAAPGSIPLWYFDETNGLWKEEGSAAKVGSDFVGDVSHFSFWNCDLPGPVVQFNCTVKNSNGTPYSFAEIVVNKVGETYSAHGYTDENGYISGPVPANSNLTINIYVNTYCGNFLLFSQTFTTTSTNISLGEIIVNPIPQANFSTVTGTVTKCNNQPVTNGYIILQDGNYFTKYALSNTGSYSFNYTFCGSAPTSINLIGEDISTLQQGNPTVNLIVAGNNLLPTIQACGTSVQEFINYTMNGLAYSYSYPSSGFSYSNGNNNGYVYGYSQNGTGSQSINFNASNIAVGSYQNLITCRVSQMGSDSSAVITTPILVNITEYGAVGQYISGNFNGILNSTQPPNNSYNINCSFRVIRY